MNIAFTFETFIRKFLTNSRVNKSTGLDNVGPENFEINPYRFKHQPFTFIVNKTILSGEFSSF